MRLPIPSDISTSHNGVADTNHCYLAAMHGYKQRRNQIRLNTNGPLARGYRH
jgi:hypothetical protein